MLKSQVKVGRRRRTQYLPMTRDEEWSFVRNHYTMVLSTLDSFGFPHSAPVWYVVIGGKIYFRAQPYKKKVRNILRKPQVCGVIEDGERYTQLRGVMVQGLAKVVDNEKTRRKQVFALLGEKYSALRDTPKLPKLWQERFGKEHRVVIEMIPTNIVSWDNRKWLNPLNQRKLWAPD